MNKILFLRSSVFLLTFFPFFLLPLGMPIDSEIMDGFGHSRCPNDHIDLSNMKGLFASSPTASLVAKNETKKLSQPFEELLGSNLELKLIPQTYKLDLF